MGGMRNAKSQRNSKLKLPRKTSLQWDKKLPSMNKECETKILNQPGTEGKMVKGQRN